MKTPRVKIQSVFLLREDAQKYELTKQYVDIAQFVDVVTENMLVSGKVTHSCTQWQTEKQCVAIQPIRLYRNVFETTPLYLTISLKMGGKVRSGELFMFNFTPYTSFFSIKIPCELRLKTSSLDLRGKVYPNRWTNEDVVVYDVEVFYVNWHV